MTVATAAGTAQMVSVSISEVVLAVGQQVQLHHSVASLPAWVAR